MQLRVSRVEQPVVPPRPAVLTWSLDRSDRIVGVGGDWDSFAERGGAPELGGVAVVGTRLSDWIADEETALFQADLVERVRAIGRPVRVPFRCDSPDERRELEMELRPGPDGRIDLTSRLLRAERREAITALDPAVPHAAVPPLRCCSWCKAIDVAGRGWQPIEVAAVALDLFASRPPPITHAICEGCRGAVLGECRA